jgi:hemerythrin
MSLIEWNNELAVHVPFIDDEHEELVFLINELYEAVLTNQSKQDLDRGLDRLILHTAAHFKHEEILFENTGYADAAKHKKQHDALTKQVRNLQEDYRQGEADLSVDVLKLLSKWLVHHMQTSDRKYSLHLHTKGIAGVKDASEGSAFQAFAI